LIYKTQGIIFRSMKYRETSMILDIYTKERGMRSFIVNGINSKKNSKLGMYQPMQILDLTAYDKDANKLNRIKESTSGYIYRSLPFDIIKSNIGIFYIDVCRNVIKEKESNVELYKHIAESLMFLDQTERSLATFPILLLIRMSAYLGLVPENNFDDLHPYFSISDGKFVGSSPVDLDTMDLEQSKAFHLLLNESNEESQSIKIRKEVRRDLLRSLIRFYQYHLDGFKEIKSLDILEALNS